MGAAAAVGIVTPGRCSGPSILVWIVLVMMPRLDRLRHVLR
jgi:hypothetical protein